MKTECKKEKRSIGIFNRAFREFVTEASFHLTLSRNQIRQLIDLAERNPDGSRDNDLSGSHWYRGRSALEAKGLVEHDRNRLTRAGRLTIELLKESGLYAEMLFCLLPNQRFAASQNLTKEKASA